MRTQSLVLACIFCVQACAVESALQEDYLAPASEANAFGKNLWKIAASKKHNESGRTAHYELPGKRIIPKEIGEDLKAELGDKAPGQTQVENKLRQLQYVLGKRYPRSLKSPLNIFLVSPEKNTPETLHPHLLGLKREGRRWESFLMHHAFRKGEPGKPGHHDVHLTLDLFKDPRATVDMLARWIAAQLGVAEDPREEDFALIVRDDIDNTRSAEALRLSALFDETAKKEDFIRQYETIQQHKPHDLWKSEETAIALVRSRIREKRPRLWQDYQRIRKKMMQARNPLRAADFPDEFVKVQRQFYAITREIFTGKNKADFQLGAFQSCPFFSSYKDALIKSFPELELNPIVFQEDNAYDSEEDGIQAVHYRLATHDGETQAIWKQYVSVCDGLRQGSIHPEVFPENALKIHDALSGIDGEKFKQWELGAFLDHPKPFARSHFVALTRSLPGIGLTPLGFEGMRNKSLLQDATPTAVKVQFSGYFPKLWAHTITVRDGIRSGILDPEDYPDAIRLLMSSYYARAKEEYASEQHMGLMRTFKHIARWKGLRSRMMSEIVPEIPWTPAGFEEDDCWRTNKATAREVRYRIAGNKETQGLFREIRDMEKKIAAGLVDPGDFSPEFTALYHRMVQQFSRTWLYQNVSREMFYYSPKKGKRRTLAEMLDLCFPLFKINPASLAMKGCWNNVADAKREMHLRVAEKWPSVWKVYREIEKKYNGRRMKPDEYSAGMIFVVEFLHHASREIIAFPKFGLGAETALRTSITTVFEGDPLRLLRHSFPEIPLFSALYFQRKNKIDAGESRKELKSYLKFRSSLAGSEARWNALETFHDYLSSLDEPGLPGKLRRVALNAERRLHRELFSAARISPRETELTQELVKYLYAQERDGEENMAYRFLDFTQDHRIEHDRNQIRLLYFLWRVSPSRMQSLLQSVSAMEPYARMNFVRLLRKVPFGKKLAPLVGDVTPGQRAMVRLLESSRASASSTQSVNFLPDDTVKRNAAKYRPKAKKRTLEEQRPLPVEKSV